MIIIAGDNYHLSLFEATHFPFWEILTIQAKNVFEQREEQLNITSLVHIRRT